MAAPAERVVDMVSGTCGNYLLNVFISSEK